MSSISPITGTGLKKCTPMKRLASGAACASRVIGIELVLLARIAVADRCAPTAAKIARLTSSRSVAASITRSQGAKAAMSATGSIRASAASASACASLPFSTARASCLPIPTLPFSASSSEMSDSTVR